MDGVMPMELQRRVEGELESGERIVWMEQPVARYFTKGALGAFLFGIPWTAFALFWMAGAAGFKWPDFRSGQSYFCLFGAPFVLIGVAMLSAPLWNYRKGRRTVYAITDQRAISFDGGRSMTIRSFYPQDLAGTYRRERPDGTGDVIMSQRQWRDSDGDRQQQEIGFMGVRNVREVERMVKELAGRVSAGGGDSLR